MISLRAHLLLLMLAAVLPAARAGAQTPADSAEYERGLVADGPARPITATARIRLLRQLRANDETGYRALTAFMARRDPAWLTGSESILAATLIADPAMLRDTALLGSRLARNAREPHVHPQYNDALLDAERGLLAGRIAATADRLDQHAPSDAERAFFNLLINHLTVHGYRAHEELNALVERFARNYPASPLVPIARRHIHMDYAEAPFGAGFSAGYGGGAFTGSLGDRFAKAYGVMLAGELYVHEITVALWMLFGVAPQPNDFNAHGSMWPAGDAQFTNVTLDGGYEFRFGRFALTPLVGMVVQNLRAADLSGAGATGLPGTGDAIGIDAAVLAGLRIPFDVGPHLDLRCRVGLSVPAYGRYDAGFGGTFWYVQAGFALVQRPYAGR